jgi:hypothetical protein
MCVGIAPLILRNAATEIYAIDAHQIENVKSATNKCVWIAPLILRNAATEIYAIDAHRIESAVIVTVKNAPFVSKLKRGNGATYYAMTLTIGVALDALMR